jgi:hypothetical protein
MSQLAKSEFQADWLASEDSAFHRARIVGPFVAIAAAVLVVVVMIAESCLIPEQRLGMFEAPHPYP